MWTLWICTLCSCANKFVLYLVIRQYICAVVFCYTSIDLYCILLYVNTNVSYLLIQYKCIFCSYSINLYIILLYVNTNVYYLVIRQYICAVVFCYTSINCIVSCYTSIHLCSCILLYVNKSYCILLYIDTFESSVFIQYI